MSVLKKTIQEFSEDRCPQMAAALAFYTMLSLVPLLVVIITIVGMVAGREAAESQFAQQAGAMLGSEGSDQLMKMLHQGENDRSQSGLLAKIISAAVLVFGATGVMAQLQASLNQTWDVEPDPKQGGIKNFVTKRLLSFGMVLAVAFILLVSMFLTAAMASFGSWIAGIVGLGVPPLAVSEVVSFIIVTLLFALMFKVLPDARVDWRNVWLGAIATAALFTLGKFLIGLYLGRQNLNSTYGPAGSVILIMLWTYYSSMIFFAGAELTQVWARHRGQPIEPKPGAVKVVEKKERVEASPGGSGLPFSGRQARA